MKKIPIQDSVITGFAVLTIIIVFHYQIEIPYRIEIIHNNILKDNNMKQESGAKSSIPILDEVTVVTAYINIGSFQKGSSKHQNFTTDLYYHWMKTFSQMNNPVVAFFDHKQDAEIFKKIRGNKMNSTRVVIFNRNATWSFSLLQRIQRIISKPNYPKHYPNTVIAEYQCIQHIKYEFMYNVSKINPFRTRYIAWADIGVFRHLTGLGKVVKPFKLYIPPAFNHSSVAYSEVTPPRNVTDKDIFYRNLYWVCGCFFIGQVQTVMNWTTEYMNYAVYFLTKELANTDQRVIYAMQKNQNPKMIIQAYKPRSGHNTWFSLAYQCRAEGYYRF